MLLRKKTLIGLLLVGIAISFVLPLFPSGTARAYTYRDTTITDEAACTQAGGVLKTSYQGSELQTYCEIRSSASDEARIIMYSGWLADCLSADISYDTNIQYDQLQQTRLDAGQDQIIGHWLDQDNGQIDCTKPENTKKALDVLGYQSLLSVVKDIGCTQSGTDYFCTEPSATSTQFKAPTLYKKLVAHKYQDVSLTDYDKYYIAFNTFLSGCQASEVTNPTDVDYLSLNNDSNTDLYRIKVLSDDSQSMREAIYRANLARNRNISTINESTGWDDGSFHCDTLANMSNDLSNAYLIWAKANPVLAVKDTTAGYNNDTSGQDAQTSCAIEGVGWLVCPVMTFLATVSDAAYTYISDSFLQVDSSSLSTTSSTYTAWSYMRNIANVAFVIVFLIIIFSQLTGTGVANYGIKKMLPRLIIAAILVNLSYFICQIAVDLSNILGFSLRNVFDIAAGASTTGAPTGGSGSNWAGIVGSVIAGVAIGYAIGLAVLIPFLVGALVAVIMTFLILVVRQMLIILLVVVSPIAFVAYLLPNTEQWFKKWRKVLTGLLLVLPMVGLLFGGADLASNILHATYSSPDKGGSDTLGQIIAQAVGVLPLFLLPSMLKNSLSAVGSIGTKINGIGSKVGGFAKGKTANSGLVRQMAENKQFKKAQVGAGVYSGKNLLSRGRSRMNRALNSSGVFNAATGGYGTARGALGMELEAKEMKKTQDAVLVRSRAPGGPTVKQQFHNAIQRGDVQTAKAAENILMGQGAGGANDVAGVLQSNHATMSAKMQTELAGNLLSNHAQAARQADGALFSWARNPTTGGDIATRAATAATWSGYSATDFLGLHDDAFARALGSGGISPETLAALRSPEVESKLSAAKRAQLDTYAPTTMGPHPAPPAPPEYRGV